MHLLKFSASLFVILSIGYTAFAGDVRIQCEQTSSELSLIPVIARGGPNSIAVRRLKQLVAVDSSGGNSILLKEGLSTIKLDSNNFIFYGGPVSLNEVSRDGFKYHFKGTISGIKPINFEMSAPYDGIAQFSTILTQPNGKQDWVVVYCVDES